MSVDSNSFQLTTDVPMEILSLISKFAVHAGLQDKKTQYTEILNKQIHSEIQGKPQIQNISFSKFTQNKNDVNFYKEVIHPGFLKLIHFQRHISQNRVPLSILWWQC